MADKDLALLVEGPTDRATLDALTKYGLLSGMAAKSPEHSQAEGKDALAANAVDHAIAELRVVVLHDFDALDEEMLHRSFEARLATAARSRNATLESGQQKWWLAGQVGHRIVLVGAGSTSSVIAGHHVDRRSLDDHLLQLVCESAATLEALTEAELRSHDKAMMKLGELRNKLEEQEVPIRTSKRLLQLLRGIIGFNASPATYAVRIIAKANAVDRAALERCYAGVCEQLMTAAEQLRSAE